MATHTFKSAYSRQIALWVLRAFSPRLARARARFITYHHDYADEDIANFLGLPAQITEDSVPRILKQLDTLRADLEETPSPVGLPAKVCQNFLEFGNIFQLNSTEVAILQFLACAKVEPTLGNLQQLLDKCISANLARYYSMVLGLPRLAVEKALSTNEKLHKCGLLIPRDRRSKDFEFFSMPIAEQLFRKAFDRNEVLKQFGFSPPLPTLGLGDFPHLQFNLDLLTPYLKRAVSRQKVGVNILLHGPPGTGKTQLARIVGQTIGIPVFEFATEDSDGDPICALARLSALRVSAAIFGNTPTLFAFDEAEDVFSAVSDTEKSAVQAHKGWFNRMLEKNKLPILWISNSIEKLDSAYVRRFDFILEVPIPPKKQRTRILEKTVGKIVTKSLIHQLAESEHLSPAVVARAHDVIRGIGKDLPTANRDAAFSRIIANTLKAQGHPDPTKEIIQTVQPGLYDIDHLNTSADLLQIAANLRKSPSARLCLYGPPGTGKTSFGHWLANEIGQPLLLRKASDLLSPYVGVTEEKIARTFETATQDGAVLLIDEVDSFLRDRTQTKHSWEVTQINEMLTQIETFSGILIASTNLINQLDPASMRRFDIKLHFGYLLPDQASRLLVSYCKNLSLPQPTIADLELAATLDVSAPGDFAAVARQHRFQPFRDARSLLQAVIAECELKANCSRRIGFH
jgi:SpoVK/Ycf46/Vps4 family AAA+-type ATPase